MIQPSTNTYRGWHLSYSDSRPVTGKYVAQSYGVELSAGSLEALCRMVDQRIRDYPGDGHGNTQRKM